jgi:hypothetical protein
MRKGVKEARTRSSGVKVNQINKDTNEIIATFNSFADAARSLNKTRTSDIGRVCNGKADSAYGYRWEKVEI